jgi:hypothetical protein
VLCGIAGRPFVDLTPFLDVASFPALADEIERGLPRATTTTYTGGTLKRMGVVAPWAMDDGFKDALDVVDALSDDDWRAFAALGDGQAPPLAARRDAAWGDETERPFTRAQERFLADRGAYFPWKTCFHFVANRRWEDNHDGTGKTFSDEALALFPRTCAFLRALPLTTIGRAVLFGLAPGDHAPAHRDSEPGRALGIAQSISFAPRGGKRFYVTDGDERVVVDARAYWFNDMDWHGVLADDAFRYSIRVDGVYEPAFLKSILPGARASAPRARRRP